MKVFLAVFISMLTTNAFAVTVFYDDATKKEVYDRRENLTKSDVIRIYEVSDRVQQIEIEAGVEATKVVEGVLTKYNIAEQDKEILDAKQAVKDRNIADAKTALGLTDEQFENLKEALR